MNKTASATVLAAVVVLGGTFTAAYALTDRQEPPRAAPATGQLPEPLKEGVRVGVVDREGNEVGFVEPGAMDRARDRIMQRMLDAGIRDTSNITETEETAYLVTEAIPVTDAGGKLTGYLAGGYLTTAEYEAAKGRALETVAAVERRDGGGS